MKKWKEYTIIGGVSAAVLASSAVTALRSTDAKIDAMMKKTASVPVYVGNATVTGESPIVKKGDVYVLTLDIKFLGRTQDAVIECKDPSALREIQKRYDAGDRIPVYHDSSGYMFEY